MEGYRYMGQLIVQTRRNGRLTSVRREPTKEKSEMERARDDPRRMHAEGRDGAHTSPCCHGSCGRQPMKSTQ